MSLYNNPNNCHKSLKEIRDEIEVQYANLTSEEIIAAIEASGYPNDITNLYDNWTGIESDRRHLILSSLANYKYEICKEMPKKEKENKYGGKRRRHRSRRNRRSNRRRTTRK